MVDEAVARALKLGWAGGYKNVESASAYLDTSEDAIRSMVKRGQLNPVRRKPKMLFTLDELELDESQGARLSQRTANPPRRDTFLTRWGVIVS